jgi:hypothetical protein
MPPLMPSTMSDAEDSALRCERLTKLAWAIPSSKDPDYDKAYYNALRAAHRPHLTDEDFAKVVKTERTVLERIAFIEGRTIKATTEVDEDIYE